MIKRRIYIVSIILLVLIVVLWQVAPPFSYPEGEVIEVKEGTGLYQLSVDLKRDGVIRSPFFFRAASIVLGGERDMKAGQYYMSRPQNVFLIAWRVLHGKHDIEVVKLTVPEGFNVAKISSLFDSRFIFFDNKEFEHQAREGYLFPDTYFIPITATASSTIKLMEGNFERKVEPLQPEIIKTKRTLGEIITMASIVENEANNKEDREIVAGILWKRLDEGLPLQVDATFAYVNGKTTKELTSMDLEIDSPYNTYVNKGLPPTPISNPGLESILATIHPTSTPYFYFLTGDDGKMYYSRTHEEHVEKKSKYIK